MLVDAGAAHGVPSWSDGITGRETHFETVLLESTSWKTMNRSGIAGACHVQTVAGRAAAAIAIGCRGSTNRSEWLCDLAAPGLSGLSRAEFCAQFYGGVDIPGSLQGAMREN